MDKKGKIEWLEILIWIVLIILFIMILTRIFGSSATDLQIYTGFITSLVAIVLFMAKHYRETGEIKQDMKYGFEKVKNSFTKVSGDINRIENKIDSLINKKL